MSKFIDFINEDIKAKRILFSTLPTKTKRDIKNFNEKNEETKEKYLEYKSKLVKYIIAKAKTFEIKAPSKNLEKIQNKINTLEHLKFILNPLNTYYEKLGFDKLIYEMSNYYEADFKSVNKVIDEFLSKFELAGIKLTANDFDYTCYVKEYMTIFLEVRANNFVDTKKLSEVFENIYWTNPEIIQHIELNFRKLIRDNKKKLINYIKRVKKEVMLENNIKDYKDCLEKLKKAYEEFNEVNREGIADIIEFAKIGIIDINHYFKDSKVRNSTYSSLAIDSLNLSDSKTMTRFYENLKKLKHNVQEYSNYLKFLPLFTDFKKEYEKQIPSDNKVDNKKLKDLEAEIIRKETKLKRINKKIFKGDNVFWDKQSAKKIKKLKIESVKQAKELYDLYKQHDEEFFHTRVLSILVPSLTISELLHLYYSFDFFKKKAIKKAFDLVENEEIERYSNEFDLFARNPLNIVTKDVLVFEEANIARVIMNKYRLYNINLTEEDLEAENLKGLLDRIDLLLRINEIEKNPRTVEEIWFMVQAEKIKALENLK